MTMFRFRISALTLSKRCCWHGLYEELNYVEQGIQLAPSLSCIILYILEFNFAFSKQKNKHCHEICRCEKHPPVWLIFHKPIFVTIKAYCVYLLPCRIMNFSSVVLDRTLPVAAAFFWGGGGKGKCRGKAKYKKFNLKLNSFNFCIKATTVFIQSKINTSYFDLSAKAMNFLYLQSFL